ncbi:MAG TPA: ABC transporter permease subunit, partial [Micrococcaceae bacterium]
EGKVQTSVLTSLQRGVIGFAISTVVATPIGLLLSQVRALRRAFGPLVSGLQVLPSVAWVPAAIIWFGLTDGTVYFVVLMGAIPSIINGMLSGVDQIPPQYRSVGRVLGASRLELALHIILPAALPGYLGGLKQGWAFSWRSLMAAEIIAMGGSLGFGLGSLLQQGRELADMGTVMAAILMILAVGIAVELLVFAPVEKRLLRSRGLLAGSTR